MIDTYGNPYEEIIAKHPLPTKDKYTKRDVDALCIASLFDKELSINNKTITEKEAKFIIAAIVYNRRDKDYDNHLSNYYFVDML